MKSKRLMSLFSDAGVDVRASNLPPESLSSSADAALQLSGLKLGEIHKIGQSFMGKGKTAVATLAIGSGFAAWSIAQSGAMLEHAIEHAQDIGVFIYENIDKLTAGWDEALPAVTAFLAEYTFSFPDGSLELGQQILSLFDHPNLLAEAIGMKLDYGTSLLDALDLVGLGADAADLVDAASTFGLSLAASWVAGKLTTKYYEGEIQEKTSRLRSLQARNFELMKLRKLLKTQLPSAVIAGQLEHVGVQHWGF